jgi:succinylglutamate desuccinylase
MQNYHIKNQIDANLEFFKTQQNLDLDCAFEISSGKKGHTVVIFGGIHGNEVAGVEAMVKFKKHFDLKKLNLKQGKIILILGNPQAYKSGLRFVNQNLNRVFDGNLQDTLESKRAKNIYDFLKDYDKIDYILDLHSVSVGEFKAAIYLKEGSNQEQVLRFSFLDTHFCFSQEDLPGTTCSLAKQLRAIGYSVECGNHLSKNSIAVGLRHILELLGKLEMIDLADFNNLLEPQNFNLPKQTVIYKVEQKIVPQKGFRFLNPQVATGTLVKKGEIYAKTDLVDYVANKDLYIVMPDKNPKISDSDAGFLCRKEVMVRV